MKRDSANYAQYRVPGRRKIALKKDDPPGNAGATGVLEVPNDLVIEAAALVSIPSGFPDQLLLLSSWQSNELTVTSILLTGWYAGDLVVLKIDGAEQAERAITQDEVDNQELVFTIPSPRADGTHTLSYLLKSEFTGDPTEDSALLTYIVDTEAPGSPQLGRLDLPEGVEAEGLSDAKLTALGDVLDCTILSYTGRIDGDTVTVYLVNEDTGSTDEVSVMIPVGGANDDLVVTFTRAQLEALGDGTLAFTYDITDLAGNTSLRSTPVKVPAFINEGMDDLLAPIVPRNADDGIIDEADAREPVQVGIPRHPGILDGDEIIVLWGPTLRSAPHIVTRETDTNDPMEFVVIPYALLLASVLTEGNNDVDVAYEVLRNGRLLGVSPVTPVVINLDQSGGIDPDPDTPENEGLGVPIVRRNGWQAGDDENVIPVADSTADATFVVPWEIAMGPGVGNAAFIEDDVIRLYYADDAFTDDDPWPLAFFEHTVTAAEVTAGVDLEFVLPEAEITAHGSGEIPVMYTSARLIRPANGPLPDLFNVAYSVKQDVTVESAGELPGGGDPLPLPIFKKNIGYDDTSPPPPEGKGIGYAPLFVQPYINMKDGDLLHVHVYAAFGRTGALGPIDRAEFGQPGDTPIPGYSFEKYVAISDVGQEVEVRYPWERIQYVHLLGQVYATVTITNAAGQSVTSGESFVIGDTRVNNNPPVDPDRPTGPWSTSGDMSDMSNLQAVSRIGRTRMPSPWSNGKPKKGGKKAR
ncbi:hypothetical protein [Pandoraea sp. PE-S2T-3]|uniref:hypothetical protein n=1 Tax=Pandoraea sp. PE-S2T-3 TaxID=1986993 RepID=UPI000B3FAC04|nr:hypothetical protein [Pandoraea sp. PE-S2T-3]